MNSENIHIDTFDLIGKYLTGQTSPEEITRLENWVKENPDHQKVFLEFKKLWINAGVIHPDQSIDLEVEWKKLESKISDSENKIRPLYGTSEKRTLRSVFRYAAIFITLIALSGFLYFLLSKPKMEELTATNSIRTARLPDGSEVTLNTGSKLIFPSKFKGDFRSVTLEGDAFFTVTPDNSKPFIVEAGRAIVKVLGTSFYLNAKSGQPDIVVTVSSGKVLFGSDSEEVILTAGEKGIFDKEKGTLVKQVNRDENFISWKTRKLVFHAERLETVFRKIGQTYGTTLKITSPEILDCRLTATFDNQSLENVLETLKATFNLKVDNQNGSVIVSGSGCND
jgi:ferric-dicitrate binding protein FerR (iron transport regulator)